MKFRVFSILSLIAGSLALASCIDEQATDEVIFNEDLAEIDGYLDTASIVSVRELYDAGFGITIVWQELGGTGLKSEPGDTLSVNYTGRLLSNQVFDTSLEQVAKDNNIFSSARDYEPLEFILGTQGLITGFQVGLLNMEKGDKATVFMPSRHAYGRQGTQDGRIPANTPIMFELELVELLPGPQE
ncbi:FKBP-type peptidyl-prolyl cis-trans isomerase FklB [Algoriphagus locisalis]|uniref:Peptidyl-prolyl cis-trans isomerase n=1 Tax=Algoriphagus locisalis TaxID=305507 RepID=A0A1I7ACP3_9BACT|nr:FKBP-type peptidyl-prolyl cis-trans isomerase [Algoriphagus locisalis]SFT72717.1 FKBP-type peptidyl-prolyl cis-trans isomerase FklB [Algoriphagus locisalis]